MKDNVVFTICAKNYIGLAQILGKSVQAHNADTDFLIFVADEVFDEAILSELPSNVIIAKNILGLTEDIWSEMTFKYDLTEFCTSIKPAIFLYLLENTRYKKVIYLDPDIYVFNTLAPIYDLLDRQSIVLTPHLARISENYRGELPDTDFLGNGIFNLGFCGVRNDAVAKKMCGWWHSKLLKNCFIDPYLNTFTDQKWMDYLPAFFTSEELIITHHLGLNIAPWNFFERKIILEDGKLMVRAREQDDDQIYPVIFVHYSGYNYTALKEGKVIQNNVSALNDYEDVKLLTDLYAKFIQENRAVFDHFISLDYSYNSFENGISITNFHRRIYRSLNNKGERISNPFECGGHSFFARLKKAGMVRQTSVNIDKVDKSNLKGVGAKLKVFNRLMRLLYRLIGFERYSLIIKLLRPYSRYESQIHLVDKRYDTDNI
ncbi:MULTISPECIES: glycosyltransferase [unclassified Sphingobacterium]|uniref:glycosyltransferase n=1 Tax=unclassified Sphingobacterium TaxID=2609468 RepID=UPI0025FB7A45|nr:MULTISPECIES: glycosyltransferase [unclassified Sphingobacterium]